MEATAISDPRIGTVLQERYRILQRLSAGGMGVVYRGERLELGRAVAIKFLHSWMASDVSFQRRFQIEAQAMSRLSHPCCVPVIDYGVQDGAPFMVMDFVTGQTLRTLVSEGGALPVRRALGLVRQVLAGLAHAHAQNIVHRDIKPDNIILTEAVGLGEQVRILDFGLAKLRDTVTGLTTGLAVGTPSYMAPEQIRAGEIDARTDLYSVGVLLFELLTGSKPFVGEGSTEVMRMHQEAAPPTLGSLRSGTGFSPQLEAAVRKAMAKHPGERFQSATEFAAALDALPEGRASSESPTVQVHAPASSSALEATVPSRSKETVPDTRALVPPRDKRPMLAVGATGVLLVGLGAALLWPEAQETQPATSAPSPVAKSTPAPKQQPAPSETPTASAQATSAPEGTVPREDLPNIEQLERWVKEGKEWRRDQTLRELAKLRTQYPQSAYAPYLEGHVNFDNLRWVDGLDSYGAAMRNNAAYRTDARLIRNVIRCLVSDRFHTKCADFLVREVGAPAAPSSRRRCVRTRTPMSRTVRPDS
ncbi:Serine/threonine protein kinase PrkC, regulator of stationary phase [Archangium gephyra]|uniref:non-specific serine/threonine protein kinase n=1 Tax=Archangium gephyra TaxID=48 RepID=A0AAC8QEJ0_9BACT|nr:serine/threonine-protein kinase [Archangium gephyra]AKJ06085.1 Serine/threonine protein kinase PrkC, regulator of stationary phase [Archangium gephyra]